MSFNSSSSSSHPPPPLASWRGDEPSSSSSPSHATPPHPSSVLQAEDDEAEATTLRRDSGGEQNAFDAEESASGASAGAPIGAGSGRGPGPVDLEMEGDEEEEEEEDIEDYREDLLDLQGVGGDASSDGASTHGDDDDDAGSGDDIGADDDDENDEDIDEEEEEEDDPEETGEFNKPKDGEALIGCKHYRRRCALICITCSKPYTCRFCHDEVEFKHELDRKAVKEVKCLECQKIQPVARHCVGCQVEFASYFCAICRLYDDEDKQQYHCEGCKICRIGGRENFFHCQTCDMCLANTMRDNHKCIEKMSRSNCPVCLEDLHTSRKSCRVPKCGHMLHFKCMQQLLKTGNYACPTCSVSMVDMSSVWERLDYEVELTPMPTEYRDLKVAVLCRDCHRDSKSAFHILGQKCTHCGSYNTCRTADPGEGCCADMTEVEEREHQQAEAEDVAAAAVREMGLASNMQPREEEEEDGGDRAQGQQQQEQSGRIRGFLNSLAAAASGSSRRGPGGRPEVASGDDGGEGSSGGAGNSSGSSSNSLGASGGSSSSSTSGGNGGAGRSSLRAAGAAMAPLYMDLEDDDDLD